VTVALLPTAPD
jgi:hypothetical protein